MRFSQQLIDYFSGMTGTTAYMAIFGVLFVCGMGVPIPEDITLISAGILVALGKISFLGATSVSLIGVMVGDGMMFYLGRRFGRKVFNLPMIRSIATPKRVERAERHVIKNARFICFVARFFPGLRSVIFLTAGTMGIRPLIFFTQDGLAALISVPLWIWFGYIFGSNIDELLLMAKRVQVSLIVAVAFAVAGYIWWKVRKRPAEQDR